MRASSHAGKKLTPQQRAIEKKRVLCRDLKVPGFDPDTFDWEGEGEFFDGLSDDEWAVVWKNVLSASNQNPLADETRVRELVNDAALSSGWFADFGGEAHISRAEYRGFAAEKRNFLKKVQQFRLEMADFFGVPPDEHDAYDPWQKYRSTIPELDQLAAILRRSIDENEHYASIVHDPPNAAKPDLDTWRAGLVLVWRDKCLLPVENTKPLRGFLIDALRPYARGQTDTMAKHFIKRWIAGEVKTPGMSLRQLFGFGDK